MLDMRLAYMLSAAGAAVAWWAASGFVEPSHDTQGFEGASDTSSARSNRLESTLALIMTPQLR